MDLTSVKTIKALLEKYGAKPSKTMGQNFLIHAPTLNKIIETANLGKEDTVLEIGPGMGILTEALAKKAKKVIAIEKDAVMIKILKETLEGYDNVEIVRADALKTTNYSLPTTNYKVVANIPYYLTSPIIRKFLESKIQPEEMVLMVQKEVAQRICAAPPHMSILAVSVQFYATAKIVANVPKGCFWPAPNVDSAIIKITPNHRAPLVPVDDFFTVVKAGFLHPRKQLANNLSTALKKDLPAQAGKNQIHQWLLANNIDPLRRAETLSIHDWVNLSLHLPDLN